MSILEDVKKALPNLTWECNGKSIKFTVNGVDKKPNEVVGMLEVVGCNVTLAALKSAILGKTDDAEQGELTYIDLPLRETDLLQKSDLNNLDDVIWQDLMFDADVKRFFVHDESIANTYTMYLCATAGASDTKDANILQDAFKRHKLNRPEQRLKAILRDTDVVELSELPTTAWNLLKIRAYKKDKDYKWDKIVVPSGCYEKLYKGAMAYEADLRTNGKHTFTTQLESLTNDPEVAALAYIDLKTLDNEYAGQTSALWDEFLLQRLHKPEYVSIFKAWTYSIAVGANNGRQEMWLYGNGSTGKSCLCKAFIKGFNELANKDICIARSKDTGKSTFNSELINKHLLIYADAKNLKSGMSELMHNLTGGDPTRTEAKGKDATYYNLYLKCLTCSNELPKVDTSDRSQTSRYIILPFTLDDDEMKRYGLMDASGQTLGSSTFQDRLDAEFNCFLASCKSHYEMRCPTHSNIDAREALPELSAIEMDEIALIEEFVDMHFEITNDPKDRLSQKDFRKQCMIGIESGDEDTGIKIYKDVKIDVVRNFLEKKYAFKWKVAKIDGKPIKSVCAARYGIKMHVKSDLQQTETNDPF